MFRYEVHGDLASGDSPDITISSVIVLLKHLLLLDVQHEKLKPGVHPSYAWNFCQVKTLVEVPGKDSRTCTSLPLIDVQE
jgi:hypothetical protein